MERNLRRIPFFSELPDEELRAISARLRRERYLKGQVIFAEGESGDALYLIDSGQVQVITGDTILAYLGPGNFFGEMALLLDQPRSASIRVVIDAEVLVLRRPDLEDLLDEYSTIARQMSRELSRRLAETSHMPARIEEYNLVSVVGPGVGDLALSLARQTGQRVIVFDMGGLSLTDAERAALHAGRVAVADSQSTSYLRAGGLAETLGYLAEQFDWVLMSASPHKPEITLKSMDQADLCVLLDCPAEPWMDSPARPKLLETAADSVSLDRLARRIARRTVGLALSGGGARGMAHIGVLRVLQEAGIPIDVMAGASAGALFGALYAAGLDLDQVTDFARGLPTIMRLRGGLWDFQIPPRSGLIHGQRTIRYLDRVLKGSTFADLRIPMFVVAADILTGEEVVLCEGPLAPALRASFSVVGIFVPYQHQDRLLIDGGAINPLPATVLAQRGANVIIGSSVIAGFAVEAQRKGSLQGPGLNIFHVLDRQMALMEREIIRRRMDPVNVLIEPRIETFTTMDYDQADALIRVGEEAARAALPDIQALLAPRPRPAS
ncbi:MAG: cyclic nucleotide-binding domain-containing protein [Chloroflexi bacterium]|nr:cyclic nucleotide-binding domain-containing protein [Chloroflexota bacterium]